MECNVTGIYDGILEYCVILAVSWGIINVSPLIWHVIAKAHRHIPDCLAYNGKERALRLKEQVIIIFLDLQKLYKSAK